MKERKLAGPRRDISIGSTSMEDLAGSIGTTGYVTAMLRFAHHLCGADFVSVFCHGDRDKPLLVGTACRLGQHRADRAAQGYRHHHDVDRNAGILLGASGEGDFLTSQDAQSIHSFTYRRDCYDLPGISSRISLIRRAPTYGLSVSLYSSVEQGVFDVSRHDDILAILRVLIVATERHVAFSPRDVVWQGQDIQTRLSLSYPDLTPREREVAAMTIKGRTATQMADILGVSETTVITHRKNAYKRMNVASMRELIAKF